MHPIHITQSQAPCYLLLLLLLLLDRCLATLLLFRCCQLLGVFSLLWFIVAIPEVTMRGKRGTGGSSRPVPAAFPPSADPRHCFRSTLPYQKGVLPLRTEKDSELCVLPVGFNSFRTYLLGLPNDSSVNGVSLPPSLLTCCHIPLR
uniref:Secreted protein n=1 Tax=Strix occidentalis caurina TaxID=311401 RepID=A0A8D0KZ01_STROC